MLSRRRCCINAVVLIILIFLSTLILLWSSSVSKYNAQEPQLLRSRQPDSSLTYYITSDNSKLLTVNSYGTSSPGFKSSMSVIDSKISRQSLNGSYKFPNELLKRFPLVMIIGFGKTGTKALYEALKLHPQLSGPYKEKRFFSLHYSIGLENYLRSLPEPPDNGFNSEKSPDYIIVPASPERIKSAASVAGIASQRFKFVVMLRDPIDRAVSEYLEWNIQRRSMNRPILPSFEDMVLDKNGNVDSSQPFINASCYAYHIQNWLKYFSKEQMCYIDGDMFVVNPLKEILKLEECLRLQHYFSERNFVYDEGRRFYCFRDPKLANNSMCMNKSKGRKHPDIPEHVVKLLKSYFQPWNSLLPHLIGRTIAWSNY